MPCNNIGASSLKVGNEFMSEIRFQTMAKGDLLFFFLYFLQDGATGGRVQYSCLLCYRVLAIHLSPERQGRYEAQKIPEGDCRDCSMY